MQLKPHYGNCACSRKKDKAYEVVKMDPQRDTMPGWALSRIILNIVQLFVVILVALLVQEGKRGGSQHLL